MVTMFTTVSDFSFAAIVPFAPQPASVRSSAAASSARANLFMQTILQQAVPLCKEIFVDRRILTYYNANESKKNRKVRIAG